MPATWTRIWPESSSACTSTNSRWITGKSGERPFADFSTNRARPDFSRQKLNSNSRDSLPRLGEGELFFLCRRLFRLTNDERFHARGFLLEARDEVVTPVFEKDDEAKRKKQEQHDPKQRAQQRHGGTVSYGPDAVNARVARAKLTLNEPLNLPWF